MFKNKYSTKKELNKEIHRSLEEFLKLKSFPFFLNSASAKDPSWETRHPGILNS